jgi:hypothetical protein
MGGEGVSGERDAGREGGLDQGRAEQRWPWRIMQQGVPKAHGRLCRLYRSLNDLFWMAQEPKYAQ